MEASAVKEKSAIGRAGVAREAGPRAEKAMDYKYFSQTRRACGIFVLN
jgi:hypothetical protein